MKRGPTIVFLGHVDHGKSTLVGRLLFDTGKVPADRVAFVRRRSTEQGRGFEFAYLLDGLAEEQEQGITIDFTQVQFLHEDTRYLIADAPGHREFLKNMLSGASRADAAFLLVDASEGVREQSRRHSLILSMLGIRQLSVVINKMDLVNWQEDIYLGIKTELEEFFAEHGLSAASYIAAASAGGDNVVRRSAAMPWYTGPTVLEQMSAFAAPVQEGDQFRLGVQDVYRVGRKRLAAGMLESGSLRSGQRIRVYPTLESATVIQLHKWPDTLVEEAQAGECIAVELDAPLFFERGMVMAGESDGPAIVRRFRCRIVWLGKNPFIVGKRYKIKLGYQEVGVAVEALTQVVDMGDLCENQRDHLSAGAIGEAVLCADTPIVMDSFAQIPATGRLVLIDGYQVAGGGIVVEALADLQQTTETLKAVQSVHLFPQQGNVSKQDRHRLNGHRSFAVWLTGLSGAGKSTLAHELETELYRQGKHVYVLDADNIRAGLNQNLGFSAADRTENIRRLAEVAKLMVDAGVIVVVAAITPYRRMREEVRSLFAIGEYIEVYVNCSLATCQKRDVKGLYKKASEGLLTQMTGMDDRFEEPVSPDIIVETETTTAQTGVANLLARLQPLLH